MEKVNGEGTNVMECISLTGKSQIGATIFLEESSPQWHYRLGHPSLQPIKLLVPTIVLVTTLIVV